MTIATSEPSITEHEAAQVKRAERLERYTRCLRSGAVADALELGLGDTFGSESDALLLGDFEPTGIGPTLFKHDYSVLPHGWVEDL